MPLTTQASYTDTVVRRVPDAVTICIVLWKYTQKGKEVGYTNIAITIPIGISSFTLRTEIQPQRNSNNMISSFSFFGVFEAADRKTTMLIVVEPIDSRITSVQLTVSWPNASTDHINLMTAKKKECIVFQIKRNSSKGKSFHQWIRVHICAWIWHQFVSLLLNLANFNWKWKL